MYNLYYIIVPNIFSANEKGKNKYARMTEVQRTNRRKRQNTLEACQQKKNHCNMKKMLSVQSLLQWTTHCGTQRCSQQKKNHCNMKKDALCAESIAMDNPLWDPEMQSPISQVQSAATLGIIQTFSILRGGLFLYCLNLSNRKTQWTMMSMT
jgi:hypothetical protein